MPSAVVDLSHPIVSGMPVYPGDPEVLITTTATVAETGFAVAEVRFGTHSGTHIDAPCHSVEGAVSVDEIDLDHLIGPATILRLPGLEPGEAITLERVGDQFQDIQRGDMVFLATGWSSHFGTPMYLRHPYVTEVVGRAILDRGARLLGVDMLNPDSDIEGVGEGTAIHQLVLGAGGYIIENLANLDLIPWARPTISALPLRLAALDGSPIRAVAFDEPR